MDKIYTKVKPVLIKTIHGKLSEEDIVFISSKCSEEDTSFEKFIIWFKECKDVELEQEMIDFFRKE